MPQDPFPLPPGDAEEPGGSPLPPAAGGAGPEDDWEGPVEQGLYVCLPAEQLTLAGFAQGGEADTMTPGPLLATVVHTVTGQDGSGLAGCSDDQLVGIISAARRMQSRSAWTEMAAMAEFAARRPSVHGPGGSPAEFAADELHLTPLSAARHPAPGGASPRSTPTAPPPPTAACPAATRRPAWPSRPSAAPPRRPVPGPRARRSP